MKKILYFATMLLIITATGCKKFLDRKPLDQSSATTFLATQDEMEQSLVGVYGASFWQFPNNTPLLFAVEASTDLAMKRGGNAEDAVAMGANGPFLVGNNLPNTCWSSAYRLVQRANQHISGMENGRNAVSANTFARIKAEALVLRAWGYFHLMYMFGDVPYYRTSPGVNEVLTANKKPVATIVADLYKDLDEAAAAFDASTSPAIIANGRVNKGVALGLKAKLALLIKDDATAAAAAGAVITGGQYGLNPSFPALFSYNGQAANANREIMFNQTFPNDILDPQNWMMVLSTPRQVTTSQSSHFPSQALVDKFEGSDGRRIDQSTTYNPASPRINRDRRLAWTIYMNGDTMVHNVSKTPSGAYIQPKERTIYNIYSNVRRKFNWTTNQYDNLVGNNDWIGAQAAGIQWQVSSTGNIGGVGYVWRKYIDSTQYNWETKTGYILMRYADVLLMYAEAKINLGQIDITVINAINAVRSRGGLPALSLATPSADLKAIVRRERAVEFAGEGLRLFDLRRWDIYGTANSGPIVGAALDPAVVPANPSFDVNDVPDYNASINQRIRFRNQTRSNQDAKYKLWPIPQFEIDVNPNGVPQNTGW